MDDFWGGNSSATNSNSQDESLDAALIDLVPIPPNDQRNNTGSNDNSSTDDYLIGEIF